MMRTTLDLPDSLLRELKTRAAQNGQSLKSLLNELIQRALRMPPTQDLPQQSPLSLPMLKRLQDLQGKTGKPTPFQSNEQFEDHALQEDIEKLRRIGFIR
jgi:plasmid stability protein